MEAALAPGFFWRLGKLPFVEAGAEAAGNGLRVLRTLVVTEAIVGEKQGFGEHPAFTVVLAEEGFDALLPVTAAGADLFFEVVEGNEGQDGVAEFRIFFLIDTPETLGIAAGRNSGRVITAVNNVSHIIAVEAIKTGDEGIGHAAETKALGLG